MHVEVLGPLPARAALHQAPQGVRGRPVRASGRLRTGLAAGEDEDAVISVSSVLVVRWVSFAWQVLVV